jgi:hypothetical protein
MENLLCLSLNKTEGPYLKNLLKNLRFYKKDKAKLKKTKKWKLNKPTQTKKSQNPLSLFYQIPQESLKNKGNLSNI